MTHFTYPGEVPADVLHSNEHRMHVCVVTDSPLRRGPTKDCHLLFPALLFRRLPLPLSPPHSQAAARAAHCERHDAGPVQLDAGPGGELRPRQPAGDVAQRPAAHPPQTLRLQRRQVVRQSRLQVSGARGLGGNLAAWGRGGRPLGGSYQSFCKDNNKKYLFSYSVMTRYLL